MITIRQIKLSITSDEKTHLIKKVSNILKINNKDIISLSIIKKSLDARNKNNLMYVYEVDVNIKKESL